MKDLLVFLNTYGLYLDESAPSIVLLAFYFLILSIFMLLNVINIGIYLLSIFIVSHEKFLNKIPSKYVYIHKLIIYYKNIRIGYILFEGVLLIFCLCLMIYICYGLVSFYIHIK